MAVLNDEFSSKYDEFINFYLKEKPSLILVKADGSPVMVKTYPKGKYLFNKFSEFFTYYNEKYLQEKDLDKKKIISEKLIKCINKAISMAEIDTKKLNKKIKEAKTNEDIYSVLIYSDTMNKFVEKS